MNNTLPLWDLHTPAPRPEAPPAERHLGIVDRPQARRKRGPLAGALTATAIVLGILACQLGLSILISGGAYEMRALELEQRDLLRVERVLAQNVDKLASPQNLVDNAAGLGMVQNSNPATLRLSDSAILGSLDSETSAVTENNVPNDTLTSMPVVDAAGLLVERGGQAEQDELLQGATPVAWKGKLPAPTTH